MNGGEPRVLSEFGAWGLPDRDDEPWWFETGATLPGDVVRPARVRDRFAAWGLGDVFGSWTAFVRESQEHQFESLKAQIEDLRLHPDLGGYVVTEFTDVHWEANGLLDLRRNRKTFHDRLRSVTGQTVIVGRPRHTRYRSGERAILDVVVAGPSGPVTRRTTWTVAELGLRGTADAPGIVEFEVPSVDRPVAITVTITAEGDDAAPVANTTTLRVFPDTPVHRPPEVAIASRWTDVATHVHGGGRAVVVATEDDAWQEGTIRLDRWSDDDDATGWIRSSGLGWLDPQLTEGLPLGPRVDLAFLGITPEHRVRGYGPEQRSDVLAGHFLGWIRDVTATIATFRHGAGIGIVCTFPLLDGDGRDAVATAMLDRLATLAADRSLAPRTTYRSADA
jgi:hypothetical protein